jgi:phosphatidylserine/phosphatidylglycerophosphate/cardiolipin synthase-like enzyme
MPFGPLGAIDLNQLTVAHEDFRDGVPLVDTWAVSNGSEYQATTVRPVFRDIEAALVREIDKADVVIGCVAWLTSVPILTALKGKHCQFVVQTEDWLRPDCDDYSLVTQRRLIEQLPGIPNYLLPQSVCSNSFVALDAVRLAGVPKNTSRNQPRMHHKFALFGKRTQKCWAGTMLEILDYHTVFTGSYNWTANATRSLENGVFLHGGDVVDAYCQEYIQVLLLSRSIKTEWWGEGYEWEPELRIGT